MREKTKNKPIKLQEEKTMKIITQNIFKYGSLLEKGIGRTPISIQELSGISRRSKIGKFIKELENILNGQSCTLSIYDCNRYGYVSLVIELDDKLLHLKKELEEVGYRSNY